MTQVWTLPVAICTSHVGVWGRWRSTLMDQSSVASGAGTQRSEEISLGCLQRPPTTLKGSLSGAPLSPPALGRRESSWAKVSQSAHPPGSQFSSRTVGCGVKKTLFPPFHLSRREEEEMSCSISRPTSQNWTTRKRLVRKKALSPRDTLTLCSLSLLSFIGPNVCQGPTAMGQAHIT